MKKKTYWMSYDLGVGGDYQHLYQWLDDHEAKPCGDSVAFFYFPYDSADPDKELLEDIKNTVKLDPGNILYVVRKKEGEPNFYGSFLYGKRKSAPWVGYGTKPNEAEDE